MMPSAEISPSYFGSPEKQLFGCYSAPRAGCARSCGVVICQPIGHEYVNSHRALRQLAVRLAESGLPVLRFDYFGAGDSYGDAVEGRIDQWLCDLSQAIAEIKGRAGVQEICLIGLRLGASLALLSAIQQPDVKRLVLWDPIVKGKVYLDGLISLSEELLRFRPKPRKNERTQWPKDIIGFPMTQELYQDIEKVDLISAQKSPAESILIVETEKIGAQNGLKDALEKAGGSVDLQYVDGPQIWQPTEDGSLLVPGAVLQAVTSWMNGSGVGARTPTP